MVTPSPGTVVPSSPPLSSSLAQAVNVNAMARTADTNIVRLLLFAPMLLPSDRPKSGRRPQDPVPIRAEVPDRDALKPRPGVAIRFPARMTTE